MTYRPTARVLTVLELLQTHGLMNARELARRLEVDERTIRRYIMTLLDMGIPIDSVSGRDGGYSLQRGHKLPPLMFNNEEVMALSIGLAWVRLSGLSGIVGTVESALAKIERVLPETLSEQLRAIREATQMSDDDYHDGDDFVIESAVLATCNLAAHKRKQLKMTYQSAYDVTERVIDIYGVVNQQRHWYAVGYCHLRTGLRSFRLDRMMSLQLLETTFTPPDEFDAESYLIESIVAMPDMWDIAVILHTPLENARRHIPRGMATLTQEAEYVRLKASIHDLNEMALILIRLGCAITVIQPPELRDELRRIATDLHDMSEDAPI